MLTRVGGYRNRVSRSSRFFPLRLAGYLYQVALRVLIGDFVGTISMSLVSNYLLGYCHYSEDYLRYFGHSIRIVFGVLVGLSVIILKTVQSGHSPPISITSKLW